MEFLSHQNVMINGCNKSEKQQASCILLSSVKLDNQFVAWLDTWQISPLVTAQSTSVSMKLSYTKWTIFVCWTVSGLLTDFL